MTIQQISVFVENKSGRLADITQVLHDNGIDIRALSIADTTNFGVLRMIVNEPDNALKVLLDKGFTVNQVPVAAVQLKDVPGEANRVLQALKSLGIGFEYAYAFTAHNEFGAFLVLRAEDTEKVAETLHNAGFTLLDSADLCRL